MQTSRLPQRGLITTLRWRIANNRSALSDELKVGKDNSDPTKVPPELNCFPHCDRVFVAESFGKISVASTRMHLLFLVHMSPCHECKVTRWRLIQANIKNRIHSPYQQRGRSLDFSVPEIFSFSYIIPKRPLFGNLTSVSVPHKKGDY